MQRFNDRECKINPGCDGTNTLPMLFNHGSHKHQPESNTRERIQTVTSRMELLQQNIQVLQNSDVFNLPGTNEIFTALPQKRGTETITIIRRLFRASFGMESHSHRTDVCHKDIFIQIVD